MQGHGRLKGVGFESSIGLDAADKVQSGGIQLSDEVPQLYTKPVAHLSVGVVGSSKSWYGLVWCGAF